MNYNGQFPEKPEQVVREYTFVIGAGQTVQLPLSGEFVAIKQAANDVGVSFNGSTPITLGEGEQIRRPFQRVEISSATAQTVKIVTGVGEYQTNRVTTSVSVTATVENGNLLTPLAGVAVGAGATVALAGADPLQLEVLVSLPSASASGVFVGDAGVGAVNNGLWLEPGVSVSIATEAAVFVYNPGATSVTVHALRNKRV